MAVSRNVRAVSTAFLGYLVLAAAYTWPLAIRLNGVPHDLGDPLLTTWLMWWSGTQGGLPLTAHWWNAPIFYPAPGMFALSENLLGLAPIAAPLTALTHQPLVGHNVAFIATIVLSALGAHFLAYTITRRHDVAAVAGIAFAFAPYRLAQAPHIQVLASFWTPVCLAALHRYDRTARPRWLLIAVAAWVIQALSCGYYLFFLAALLTLWFLWFAVGRWPVRRLGAAVVAFAAGALLLAPLFRGYQVILNDYGLKRSIGEIRAFSADIAGLLYASDELLAWGWVHLFQGPESNLFPGLTIVLLAAFAIQRAHPFRRDVADTRPMRLLGLVSTGVLALLLIATAVPIAYGAWQLTIGGVRLLSIARADKPLTLALAAALVAMASLPRMRAAFHRRSVLEFYLVAAFVMWMFALGPDPKVMGQRALYQAPYGQLMRLPGFDGLRVPARFWMMSLACLSVVGALAVDRLSGRSRRTLVAVAITGLLVDGWPREFRVLPAPEVRPSPSGVSARLDLPIDEEVSDARAMYQQMFDPVPLFNGFSGYIAPHYYAMRALLEDGDGRILPVLAAHGPLGVVIDHAGDADGALRKLVLAAPGAAVERMEHDWSSYRVPRSVAAPDLPDQSGTPIRIKSLTAAPKPAWAERALDGNMMTAWSTRDEPKGPAEVTIELDTPAHVGQIVINLGGFATDFPKRLQIDVSVDGIAWETAWTGSTALNAYYAAIRHPREMPMVLPLNRDRVRFIRLRQVEFDKYDWSIPELHVLR
jgi:F5/8 type C domain